MITKAALKIQYRSRTQRMRKTNKQNFSDGVVFLCFTFKSFVFDNRPNSFDLISNVRQYAFLFSCSRTGKNNNRFLSVEYYKFIVRLQNKIIRVLLNVKYTWFSVSCSNGLTGLFPHVFFKVLKYIKKYFNVIII